MNLLDDNLDFSRDNKDWDFLKDKSRTAPLTYKYKPTQLGKYDMSGPRIQAGAPASGGGLMSSPAPVTSQNGTGFSGALGSFLKPIIKKGTQYLKDKLTASPPSTDLPDVPEIPDSFYKPPEITLPNRPPTGIGDVWKPETWTGELNPFTGIAPDYKSQAFNPENYMDGDWLYNGEFSNVDTSGLDKLNYQMPQGGGLMDSLGEMGGKLYEMYQKYMPVVGGLTSAYDILTNGYNPERTLVYASSFLPMLGAGPAGAAAGIMQMGLSLMQAIGANHNKPSRDYFDPSMHFDLGEGNKLLIGDIRGGWEDQTPGQDWNQALYDLGRQHTKRGAYIMDENTGQVYEVPLDQLFSQGLMGPETQRALDMDQKLGMSGNTVAGNQYQWLGQTYTPDAIKQAALQYMQSDAFKPVQLGMFKDTPVVANTGKDPLVFESLLSAFQAAGPYWDQQYGQFNQEWRPPGYIEDPMAYSI